MQRETRLQSGIDERGIDARRQTARPAPFSRVAAAAAFLPLLALLLLPGCLGSLRSTPNLLGTLRNGNTAERSEAAYLLGKRGPEAVVALIEALHDPELDVQRAAAAALADQADLRASPALEKAIFDRDRLVRFNAARALLSIGTPEAIGASNILLDELIAGLHSDDPQLRKLSEQTLELSPSPRAQAALQQFHQESTDPSRRSVDLDRVWKEP